MDSCDGIDSLPNRIAACALHHYNKGLVGAKGKPKIHQEWTVYSAIVAEKGKQLWVVSCATGTKCTGLHQQRQCGDCIVLHDAHAEVLARRGLMRVLWSQIQQQHQQQQSTVLRNDVPPLLILSASAQSKQKQQQQLLPQQFQLHPEIELHLYISDSPCGDASIYSVSIGGCSTNDKANTAECNHTDPQHHQQGQQMLFTGAKVIVSKATGVTAQDCGGDHQLLSSSSTSTSAAAYNTTTTGLTTADAPTTTAVMAREEIQLLGALRTKSGRSNIPNHLRSTSMSCSDKIVLWSLMGLQGGILTQVLEPPYIPLTSIVVSRDPRVPYVPPPHGTESQEISPTENQQLAALQRAVVFRAKRGIEFLNSHLQQQYQGVGGPALRWKPQIPTVHLVTQIFPAGKAAMSVYDDSTRTDARNNSSIGVMSGQKRKYDGGNASDNGASGNEKPKVSPCGVALNWNESDGEIELLVGGRGIRQGKKPKFTQDYEKLASRLSRSQMVPKSMATLLCPDGDSASYQQFKKAVACSRWSQTKTLLLSKKGSPLVGWLRNVDDGDCRT
jgi:tRNA-specific adenosine deaminase 1